MPQPDPTTPAEPAADAPTDAVAAEAPTDAAGEEDPTDDPAPLNRADRRAKAKAAAKAAAKSTGHAGPPPDLTLRRGRGPRSHTKRI